MLQILQI